MEAHLVEEILTIIIKNLVTDEKAISIKKLDDEKSVTYEVKVAESDMGKVIGKDGRIAKAIRTIMKSIATKENKKINIEFID